MLTEMIIRTSGFTPVKNDRTFLPKKKVFSCLRIVKNTFIIIYITKT